jgi:hypothetical protein
MLRRSKHLRRWLAGDAIFIVLAWCSSAHAAEPDDFRALSAADLVALCSTTPEDANYVAAIHFCHGFAAGAYQYYQAIAAASPDQRYVCPPAPPPSRSDAISGFLGWMERRPGMASKPPVEALFQYLGEAYPCK